MDTATATNGHSYRMLKRAQQYKGTSVCLLKGSAWWICLVKGSLCWNIEPNVTLCFAYRIFIFRLLWYLTRVRSDKINENSLQQNWANLCSVQIIALDIDWCWNIFLSTFFVRIWNLGQLFTTQFNHFNLILTSSALLWVYWPLKVSLSKVLPLFSNDPRP